MAVNDPNLTPADLAKIETVVLTLDADDLAAEIVAGKFGLDAAAAKKAVKRARKSIDGAGAVDVEKELGKSLKRLNLIFSTSTKAQDTKTALATQKEFNKIFDAYRRLQAREEATKEDPELASTRAVLASVVPNAEKMTLTQLAQKVVFLYVEARRNKE